MRTRIHWLALCVLGVFAVSASAQGTRDRVLIVTGESEYKSEQSLGELGKILSTHHKMKVAYVRGLHKKPGAASPELVAGLKSTDLLILYVRFLQLPEAEVAALSKYFDNGGAFIVCRTSTHLFRYARGSAQELLNEDFPVTYFGTPYRGHHGHGSSQVNYVMAAKHPIMRGVTPRFWTPDFLYAANPLSVACSPLIVGQALKGREEATFKTHLGSGFLGRNHCDVLEKTDQARTTGSPHPVLWTVDSRGGRGLVSTIAARNSFSINTVKRLYVNAVFWCLNREAEIPATGSILALLGD